jgi:tetratricopeptide (TPR) repeat protein
MSKARFHRRRPKIFIWVCLFFSSGFVFAVPTPKDLEVSFGNGQWDESVEIAHELVAAHPNFSLGKLRAGYALFQRGFSNAALKYLKQISPSEWKTLPQGQDRLMEIVSLFQKKVPLNVLPGRLDQLDENVAAPSLKDEILYSKGRRYFEVNDFAKAAPYFESISKNSRFFAQARYLLGTMAASKGDYKMAALQFSRTFEPAIFEQGSEFWKDISTQLDEHWGPSLKVLMDADFLNKSNVVAELSLIALARVAYGNKDFETALDRYSKIPSTSRYYSQSALERIWTLLALNRNDEAQKLAAELSLNEASFQALQARPLRALILADSGRAIEARDEITRFQKVYEDVRASLIRFQQFPSGTNPPPFLKAEMDGDDQFQMLTKYTSNLKTETEALRSENLRLFPAYMAIANSLEPLSLEARGFVAHLVENRVQRRIADLETMYVQSKLIAAETYLDEREKLRKEFHNKETTDSKEQQDYDNRLVDLLTKAVKEVDEASARIHNRHLNLEFRQSELLWELSKAHLIVGQASHNSDETSMGEALRLKSLKSAEDIVQHFPSFPKRAQAMFFTGFAYLELDRTEEGVRTFEEFLKEFPKNEHAPDAERILGDMKFDENKFQEAQAYYTKILEFQNSPIVGYALYKIGWCAYNQKNYGKALLGLEQAVLWSAEREKTMNLLSLRREARHDLIAMYSEVGDHKKALEYFETFFGGEALSWLADLAEELEKNGQYEKSSDLFKQLSAVDPTAGENLAYQASIIRGEYKLHRWDNVLAATKQLAERYGTRFTDPKPQGTPEFLAEALLREVVLAQHFEFSKSERPEDLSRILALDDLYLTLFDAWPSVQDPLFHHAYFLAKHLKAEAAAEAYKKHWLRFKDILKEPVREEALRNFIHSLEIVEKSEKATPQVLSATAKEILQYSEEYAKTYPKSANSRPIALLRSAILFKYELVDDAISESQKLFLDNPSDSNGKIAFNNLRTAYYKEKDWKKTYEWASNLSSQASDLRFRAFSSELQTVKEESLFLWAENSKDDLEAATLFMKIAEDSQMMRLHEKSLYDAFVRFQKAGKKIEALEAADRLEKIFPKFEHLPEIAGVRAALYQEAGDYERALPLLLVFVGASHKDVTEAIMQQARLNAALIAEATLQYPLAEDLYGKFLKLAVKGSPGFDTATNGLEHVRAKTERGIASQSSMWNSLLRQKSDFERNPLPKSGDLASRIKGGGLRLEQTAKRFLDLSSSSSASSDLAFEAYCAVPFLYKAYSQAVQKLATQSPKEVRSEIERIAEPIGAKAEEIAIECLTKSAEAEHDGPMFRRAMGRWGWESKSGVRDRVSELTKSLALHYPWLEPNLVTMTEKEIIEANLKDSGSVEDNWYSLALQRAHKGRLKLAKLTLEDAILKFPHSGKLLNAFAYLRQASDETGGIAQTYERAAAEGSTLAWANLALYQLKGARLLKAQEALKHAYDAKIFDDQPSLKKLVEKEFL